MNASAPLNPPQPTLLRQRPLLWVCCASLLLLCFGIALTARTWIANFEAAEATATAQKALQINSALEADLRQLSISNRDYAEWDDAAEFLDSRNPKFIAANFIPNTLTSMHVDLVWIVDREGNDVYSAVSDRTSAPLVSPAPRQALRALTPFARDPLRLMALPAADRLIATDNGPAAVSAMHITHSDRSQDTGATLIFVRYLKGAELDRIRAATQLNIEELDLDGQLRAARTLSPDVRQWLTRSTNAPRTFVQAANRHELIGYTLARSIDQRPLVLFFVRSPRDLFALAVRQTWISLGSILGLFILCGGAILAMYLRMRRSFLSQLALEARYRHIAEQLPEKIVLVDAVTHAVHEANHSVLGFVTRSAGAPQTLTVQEIFPDLSPEILRTAMESGTGRRIVKSRAVGPGGVMTDNEVAVSVTEIEGRRMLTLVGHDVSHRLESQLRERANNHRLRQLAEHDSLTGLPNRLYLHTRLPQLLKKLTNSNRLLAAVYVDVDHFKNINDSRGHAAGDELLQTVARRLKASVPPECLVARVGGDEFVAIAPLMPDVDAIENLAIRLQTAVSTPVALEGETVTVTASLGIAVYPRDGVEAKTLLKNADMALYKAKEMGRHTHQFFTREMSDDISQHVELEQALRVAIDTPQIFMEYQPVIDLRTGRLSSLEALMRWRHPVHGLIAPSQFIPVAESSGLIVELGQSALRSVLTHTRAWLDMDVPIVPIAVNVSPVQLNRFDFADVVQQLAVKAGVDPHWLRFEITESAVLRDPERLIETLNSLRKLGAQILIDDFGTGYSSLSYLNRLPVDTLKIDQSFVRELGEDATRVSIISSIIDMAKKLKLGTVAEGVETADQVALLREHGCDSAQGYYFSRPVSVRHCRPLLEELRREKALTQTMLVRAISNA